MHKNNLHGLIFELKKYFCKIILPNINFYSIMYIKVTNSLKTQRGI